MKGFVYLVALFTIDVLPPVILLYALIGAMQLLEKPATKETMFDPLADFCRRGAKGGEHEGRSVHGRQLQGQSRPGRMGRGAHVRGTPKGDFR